MPWYAADLHTREAFEQHFFEMLEVMNIKSAEPASIIVGSASGCGSGGGGDSNGAAGTGVVQAAVL